MMIKPVYLLGSRRLTPRVTNMVARVRDSITAILIFMPTCYTGLGLYVSKKLVELVRIVLSRMNGNELI